MPSSTILLTESLMNMTQTNKDLVTLFIQFLMMMIFFIQFLVMIIVVIIMLLISIPFMKKLMVFTKPLIYMKTRRLMASLVKPKI